MASLRVLSLLPAATDTVRVLNLERLLVGRSHECDAEGTEDVPVCTEAKYAMGEGMAADEVHAAHCTAGAAMWETAFGGPSRAATLVEWGLSPYRTDAHRLRELQPDVVLTQVQDCGGAVSHQEVEQALHEWVGKSVSIVHLDPKTLDDVWQDIEQIGTALHSKEEAQRAIVSLKQRMDVVKGLSMGRPKRRVMCVQWAEPLFLAGAWVPEIVRLAGGLDVANDMNPPSESSVASALEGEPASIREVSGRAGEAPPSETQGSVSWSFVRALAPDAVVFAICGCGLEESMKEVTNLLHKGVLRELKAGVEAAVVDAARLFSRPGPTLVESVEVLAEILHPESQSFGHAGKLWKPFKALGPVAL